MGVLRTTKPATVPDRGQAEALAKCWVGKGAGTRAAAEGSGPPGVGSESRISVTPGRSLSWRPRLGWVFLFFGANRQTGVLGVPYGLAAAVWHLGVFRSGAGRGTRAGGRLQVGVWGCCVAWAGMTGSGVRRRLPRPPVCVCTHHSGVCMYERACVCARVCARARGWRGGDRSRGYSGGSEGPLIPAGVYTARPARGESLEAFRGGGYPRASVI